MGSSPKWQQKKDQMPKKEHEWANCAKIRGKPGEDEQISKFDNSRVENETMGDCTAWVESAQSIWVNAGAIESSG
jgi:hypothetical protein